MALEKSYTDAGGTVHASAYHRLEKWDLQKDGDRGEARIMIYKDAASVGVNKHVGHKAYYYHPSSTPTYDAVFGMTKQHEIDMDVAKAVYDDIKTKSEYSGALDV